MRKFVLNLHLTGALIGGLFLSIVGGTGGILAFQNELDHFLNPSLFEIPSEGPVLPLSAIQDLLAKSYPDMKFRQVFFPSSADRPYVAQAGATQVFVNSHTGAIVGSRETPTPLDKIHDLHTSLLLGKTGRPIVQAATFLSLFLIITGIYLWWPLRHSGTSRGLSFYLHLTLGIYFALFLLLITITGLVLAFEGVIMPLVLSATHTSPVKYDAHSTVVPGATPITPTAALGIASGQLPGTTPHVINFPGSPTGCYGVVLKYPGTLDDDSNSWVLVDQYSGEVLYTFDSHAIPAGPRIMMDNDTLHTGRIFGLPSQIIMSLSSFVLVVQTITGYLIWWRKLRKDPPCSGT
jgi:uncharacterized iron-regulated membrane protein